MLGVCTHYKPSGRPPPGGLACSCPALRTVARRVIQPVARRGRQHPPQRRVEVGRRHLRKPKCNNDLECLLFPGNSQRK